MNKNITPGIIRELDIADLRKKLRLDYIFQAIGNHCQWYVKKMALIVYFSDVDLIDKCLAYIKGLPQYVDVFILTKNEEIAKLVENNFSFKNNHTVIDFIEKYKEINTLFSAYKDTILTYEYFGFIYDERPDKNERFQTVKHSLFDLRWENTVKNDVYITHIIETFENEPQLGILMPPPPYMSDFFKTGFCGWESYYEETICLAKQLNLRCEISRDKPRFVLADSFWCRTKVLEPLLARSMFQNIQITGNESLNHLVCCVIERILPYVAQSQGYYNGIMMTAEYASLYAVNYQYMWDEMVKYDKK